MNRIPSSTYRLQLSAEFTLADAAELADYLKLIGADWYYLSPLLQATGGSTHGYDVVDHSRVDESRGGAQGLETLAAAAQGYDLGVLVDIVPNHVGVAVPRENAWWWDVLLHGQGSRWAEYFDIDWPEGEGKLRIPVLGESIVEASASGALRVATADGTLHYYDHVFPLAPGSFSDGAPAHIVHGRQHYELIDWHRADGELNYRRFFAVNELAGIRVEIPEVFDDSHAEILRWVREGLVHGIRVDHPDGLADPGGYLDRLSTATDGTYVLVEKILESGEQLPPYWAAAGTTGYDALAEIDRVLIDPEGRLALDAIDSALRRGGRIVWTDLIHATKRGIADGILGSEVRRLVRDHVAESGSTRDEFELGDALAELLACFPVYRSYLPWGAEHLDFAATEAMLRRPELDEAIAELHGALSDATRVVAIRFQQTSGMVMAKGVEDTAFYRTSRLASLTEVGADPSEFSITPDEFHLRLQNRLAAFPASMTTLSTHDTKRGEDTRARISVISEVPEEWAAFLQRRRQRRTIGDGPLENLLWESVVGAWPRDREALHGYAEKAARESGSSTNWADPDESFEVRLHALIDDIFDHPETASDVAAMAERLSSAGWSNSLSAKLLQLTAPGVPDVYQGSELWEVSLVDPDNRRPVDFASRRAMLAALDTGELPAIDETGAAKLLVTSRALRLRRDRPELFDRYTAVPAFGEASDHLVAFDRGGAITIATRLPIGLSRVGGWGQTSIIVPSVPIVDVLTRRVFPGGELWVEEVLSHYPVALLARMDEL